MIIHILGQTAPPASSISKPNLPPGLSQKKKGPKLQDISPKVNLLPPQAPSISRDHPLFGPPKLPEYPNRSNYPKNNPFNKHYRTGKYMNNSDIKYGSLLLSILKQ